MTGISTTKLTGRFYERPKTIGEAVALLDEADICILAGGTDLVIMRAEGMVISSHVADIKHIAGMSHISTDDTEIAIGAATDLDGLARYFAVSPNAISDGAALVGAWQTRCRATIGGNICRASPAADTLCGTLVHDAQFELVSRFGRRLVAAREFFVGPGKTLRKQNELLTRIIVSPDDGASAYLRFTYRNAMDLSVAGVAAHITLEDGICTKASIAVGACGPTAFLVPEAAGALIGKPIEIATVQRAAEAVVARASPIDDVRGTRKHRLHVLHPLTCRVVLQAAVRAADKKSLPQ
jgi:carbon-monoxide dehydrogenase medium subunit